MKDGFKFWRKSVKRCQKMLKKNENHGQTTKYSIQDLSSMIGIERKECEILIIYEDCLVVASNYSNYKVGLLNFANPKTPGLDCRTRTQEEYLLHSTSLPLNLIDFSNNDFDLLLESHSGKSELYPLSSDHVIYSKDVTVFSVLDDQPVDKFKIDIITSAAIKYPKIKDDQYLNKNDELEMKKIIKLIFLSAIRNNVEVLILGAFGCGNFGCPVKGTVEIFRKYIDKYSRYFCKIIFPIINDDFGRKNYQKFVDAFRK
jgi:uncharacterized protein (TIGR02452 family)